MIQALTLPLRVTDVTGQRAVDIPRAPADASIGELLDGAITELNMPRTDSGGNALTYHARLDRDGRHLHSSELVGELSPNDRLTIQPEIHAGAGSLATC